MKSTKASIALYVVVFLIIQGEAHTLQRHHTKFTADAAEASGEEIQSRNSAAASLLESMQSNPPRIERLGSLQVSITWSRNGDGDLVVKTPSGKVISYDIRGPSLATDYGRFEADRSGLGPENVYWANPYTPPNGTYQICLRTSPFNPSPSNPVTATATIFRPDGTNETITKTFTQGYPNIDCDPSKASYMGSFTHPKPTPLPAPTPTPTPTFAPKPSQTGTPTPGPTQLAREGIRQFGDLQFMVTWNRPGDGDIFVKTPTGKIISYNNRGPSEATDYGQLEQDRNGLGPESVFWDSSRDPPAGTYQICLRTGSFNISYANPLYVQAMVLSPTSEGGTTTQTFTEASNSMVCDPSAPNFVRSFTYIARNPAVPRGVIQFGLLQFTVTWSRIGDGYLLVKTPTGKVISNLNDGPSQATDYGQLELDRTGLGPESIYWDDYPPVGIYQICFQTNAFNPSSSNPVMVTATIFTPDGDVKTITKTFTQGYADYDCNASKAHYIGSYTYRR